MAKFEKVSRFANADVAMPIRKTAQSAGYDMVAAEDVIIPPYDSLFTQMLATSFEDGVAGSTLDITKAYTLDEIAALTKKLKAKPTLVSTGMKCKLAPDQYLQLSVRSSCPLKHWLMMGNSVGIIDADYYNNPDNEGEIFFQIYNMSPFPIKIQKGEAIGQGIIYNYIVTEDDAAKGERLGGFGSTTVGHSDESAMMPAT